MVVPLTPEDRQFLKRSYQTLQPDLPLKPESPLYERVYDHPGCEDPINLMQRSIEFSEGESVLMFSGFRGSGKTTELFRLQKSLEALGYIVLYADALEYVNPAVPIEISDLLITLAGAFSDALQKRGIDLRSDAYWTKFWNWLNKTEISVKELGFSAEAGIDPVKAGSDLKLEFRTTPSFKHKLAAALSARIGELQAQVTNFFEEGVKVIRRERGNTARIVFLFDSLEQIRGSISNEQEVTRSVELLFSVHLKLLAIPYVHVVYTVPPWLKFVLPGANMVVLPSVRIWDNDAQRSPCHAGIHTLQSLAAKRFGGEIERFLGPDHSARTRRFIDLCGGHFRDLLLLLRETVLRTNALPVPDEAIQSAIVRVQSTFLPISLDDAEWLGQIERERATLLKNREPAEITRLTRFLDTPVVLYIRNGQEWYDVHPLIRDEVKSILAGAGTGG